MAFITKEIIDLKGILLLVLLTIPSIAATNLDCNGKAFRCVNATHFMICVDLGTGVSTTIDDFVLPCPLTTVCRPTNRFECEFPTNELIETTTPEIITGDTEGITKKEATSYTDSTTSVPFNEYVNTINTTTLSEFELSSATTRSEYNENVSEPTTVILENVEISTATTLAEEMFESSTASIDVENVPNNLLVIPHESKSSTTISIPETTVISTSSELTNQSGNTDYITNETLIVTSNFSSTEPSITEQLFTEDLFNNSIYETIPGESLHGLDKNLTFEGTTEIREGTVTSLTDIYVDRINASSVINETKMEISSTVNSDNNVLQKHDSDYTTMKASTDIFNNKLDVTESALLNTNGQNLNTIINVITTEAVTTNNDLFTINNEPTSENTVNKKHESTSENALITEYNILSTVDSLATLNPKQETITNTASNIDSDTTSYGIIASTKVITTETTIDMGNSIDLLTTTIKIDNLVKPNNYSTNDVTNEDITNVSTVINETKPEISSTVNSYVLQNNKSDYSTTKASNDDTESKLYVTEATVLNTNSQNLNTIDNVITTESVITSNDLFTIHNEPPSENTLNKKYDTTSESTFITEYNILSTVDSLVTLKPNQEIIANAALNKDSDLTSPSIIASTKAMNTTETTIDIGNSIDLLSTTIKIDNLVKPNNYSTNDVTDEDRTNASSVINETKPEISSTVNSYVLQNNESDYTSSKVTKDVTENKSYVTEATALNTISQNLNTIDNVIPTESVITSNDLFTLRNEPTSENTFNKKYDTTSESAFNTEYNILSTVDSLVTLKPNQEIIANAALKKDSDLTSHSIIASTKAMNTTETNIDIGNSIDLLTTTIKIDNLVKPNNYSTNDVANEVINTTFITNSTTERSFTDPTITEKDDKVSGITVSYFDLTTVPVITQTTARELKLSSEISTTSKSEFSSGTINDITNQSTISDTAKMSETPLYKSTYTVTENIPNEVTEYFEQNIYLSTQSNNDVIKETESFTTQRTGSGVITEASLQMQSTDQITIPDAVVKDSLNPNIEEASGIFNNTLVNQTDVSLPNENIVSTTDNTALKNPGIVFRQTITTEKFRLGNTVATEKDINDKTSTITTNLSKDKLVSTTNSKYKASLNEHTVFMDSAVPSTYIKPQHLRDATMLNSESSGIESIYKPSTVADTILTNSDDGNVLEDNKDEPVNFDFTKDGPSQINLNTISTDFWSSVLATTTESPKLYTRPDDKFGQKISEIANESPDHSTDGSQIGAQNYLPYSTTPLLETNHFDTSEYFPVNEQKHNSVTVDRELLGFNRSESTISLNTDLIQEEAIQVAPAVLNNTTEIEHSSNASFPTTIFSNVLLNMSQSFNNFSYDRNHTKYLPDPVTESLVSQGNIVAEKGADEFYTTTLNNSRTEFTTESSHISGNDSTDKNQTNYSNNLLSKSDINVDYTTENILDSISISENLNGINQIKQVTDTVQSTDLDYKTSDSQFNSNVRLPVEVEKRPHITNINVTTNSYNVHGLVGTEIVDGTTLKAEENKFDRNISENEFTTNISGAKPGSEIFVTHVTGSPTILLEEISSTNDLILKDFDRSSDVSTQRTEFLQSTTYFKNLPDDSLVQNQNTTQTSKTELDSETVGTLTEGSAVPLENVSSTDDRIYKDFDGSSGINTIGTDFPQSTPSLNNVPNGPLVQKKNDIVPTESNNNLDTIPLKSVPEKTSIIPTQYTEFEELDTTLQSRESVHQNSATSLHEKEANFIFHPQLTTTKSSIMTREQTLQSTAGGVTLPIDYLQNSLNTPSLNGGSVLKESGNDVKSELDTQFPPLISEINSIDTNNNEAVISFTETTSSTAGIASISTRINDVTTTTLFTDKTTNMLGIVPESISIDSNNEELRIPVTEINSTTAGIASKSIRMNEESKTTLLGVVPTLTATLSSDRPQTDILEGEDIQAPIKYTTKINNSGYVASLLPLQSVTDVNYEAPSVSTEKSLLFEQPSDIVTDAQNIMGVTTGKGTHSGIISLNIELPTSHKKNTDEQGEEMKVEEEPENNAFPSTTATKANEKISVNEENKLIQNNYSNNNEVPIMPFKRDPVNDQVEIVTTNEFINARSQVESHLTSSPTLRNGNKHTEKTTDASQIPSLQISTTPHYSLDTKSSRAVEYATENLALQATTNTPKPNADIYDCKHKRGRYANEHDCRKFYICLGNGHIVAGNCPVNTVFSEFRKQCTTNLSHCVRKNQFQCLVEGRFSDYLDENIYYICVRKNNSSFTRFKLQCLNGYHLNRTSVKCELNKESRSESDSKSESSSTTDTTSESSPSNQKSEKIEKFKCKKEGKFPDPTEPRRYFECIEKHKKYQQKKKKCKSNKIFDKEKKTCVVDDSNASNESG